MTERKEQFDEDLDFEVTPKLSADLKAVFEPAAGVPPEVDRAVMDRAHKQLTPLQSANKNACEFTGSGEYNVNHSNRRFCNSSRLMKERIIIAAFNTGGNLPKGRTQVATIHLQIIGDVEPQYELKLIVAADADGKEIPAKRRIKVKTKTKILISFIEGSQHRAGQTNRR